MRGFSPYCTAVILAAILGVRASVRAGRDPQRFLNPQTRVAVRGATWVDVAWVPRMPGRLLVNELLLLGVSRCCLGGAGFALCRFWR